MISFNNSPQTLLQPVSSLAHLLYSSHAQQILNLQTPQARRQRDR